MIESSLAEQIAERNASAYRQWEYRLFQLQELGIQPFDAWPPVWRERLSNWFKEQHELAQRWLFKRRCAKRIVLRSTNWAAIAKIYKS